MTCFWFCFVSLEENCIRNSVQIRILQKRATWIYQLNTGDKNIPLKALRKDIAFVKVYMITCLI